MKRFKKILFSCAVVILVLGLLFGVASLVYRFTGSEIKNSHPIFYFFPARSYPVDAGHCLAAGGYEHTPDFSSTPSCQFESMPKFHSRLLHCPKEGRIVKQKWCGDFYCSYPLYACVIEFALIPNDQTAALPQYELPSPEDVYSLAQQFDVAVTPDEFYMMSNAELYFTYGQYLAQQQQLPYQAGYILLAYAAESDLRLHLDTEEKLREAGIVLYDPTQSYQQPGLDAGFNADYYFAQQSKVRAPFDMVQIRLVGEIAAAQDLELSAEQLFQVRSVMTALEKSTALPGIHCEAVYEQDPATLIECVYGEISDTTMQQYLVDAGIIDYTLTHYTSVLVPYGQEDYWGKVLSEWEEFAGYQLNTF